jgi:hypothetical protein
VLAQLRALEQAEDGLRVPDVDRQEGHAREATSAPSYNPAVDARDERTAANEALLREVNDRIESVGRHLRVLPDDDRLDFRCECGREDCDGLVSMSVAEYEHVRADNDRFAVVPGHEDPELERVVERAEGYVIVDKKPGAEPFVGADGQPDSGA